mmetsp:Transcript_485/g.944  ORF Transcript_485/g.944 Transcript_485/m.944 type:complete len:123 (+) Transcript_485:1185-1553(+)
MLGTFGEDAVPAEDTRQDVIEHVVKRIVPGSDNAEYSQGDIFDVGIFVHHHWVDVTFAAFQPSLAVMKEGAYFFACGQDFTEQGIHLRLSRVLRTELTDFVNVRHNVFLEGAKHASSLREGR